MASACVGMGHVLNLVANGQDSGHVKEHTQDTSSGRREDGAGDDEARFKNLRGCGDLLVIREKEKWIP